MRPPLAYFLTWTARGTWLHGDPRGSVDRTHNSRSLPPLPADPRRHALMQRRTKSPATLLDRTARNIVEDTIRAHCEHRRWKLITLNARTNHIHVILTCPERTSPEDAMAQLKAWCTRRLREAGCIDATTKPWTQHGSTRWINTEASLVAAIDYVTNHQDGKLTRPNSTPDARA